MSNGFGRAMVWRKRPGSMWVSFALPRCAKWIGSLITSIPLQPAQTPVQSITRHKSSTDPAKRGSGKWIVNGDESQIFDGVSVNVGTCGKPKRMELPGQDRFKGQIVHSSELDDVELSGKKVSPFG